MKAVSFVFAGALLLIIGCNTRDSGKVSRPEAEMAPLEAAASLPPESLDRLYPPKAEAPVFFLKMLGLGSSLSGIAADLSQNDIENARATFGRFTAQYAEAAQLVPQWQQAFDVEPVNGLGAALESGDPKKVVASFGQLEQICHNCHVDNMSVVQHKYRWGDFSNIGVADPVTGEDVDFKRLMLGLASSFEGIRADLQQGQAPGALKHHGAAKKRFQALEQTCQACHETERRYYVDKSIQVLIAKLGAVLAASPPDQKLAEELNQGIASESCGKCHLVHMPAALAKARLERQKKATGGLDEGRPPG